MSVFLNVPKIAELSEELKQDVRERFEELCEDNARKIATTLFELSSPSNICSDINNAMVNARDLIHQMVVKKLKDGSDVLLVGFTMPEKGDINWNTVAELSKKTISNACRKMEKERSVAPLIEAYAYEAWTTGISNALEKVLKEMCEEIGY